MTEADCGLIPYPARRHHHHRLGIEWIFTALCGVAALAGVLIGMAQRPPQPVALTCTLPPVTMPVSEPPVALRCVGSVAP